ncbi:phosphomannose isomerase type II C-terminal cupin domain, partial [Patescibacteria group bacterium]|nr:phosphomannose isomerase type II C-terminal cupin domain [Patescibacteria group bacterium]
PEEPFTEERPWGNFRQYCHGESVTVKTIFVKKGARLSLQYHHGRDEFWHIISGTPEVTIGTTITDASPGDEFEISRATLHRIGAPRGDALFLEISRGNFDETDIVRVEDEYGRAKKKT